ncbi:MAG: ROK family protein [Bacteroidetes bacterium]|nr:ROK family protein [Bacteroidota bacterium]
MKEITYGLDIGGTNSVIGIVDREGQILAEDIVSTRQYPVVEDFVEACYFTMQKLKESLGEEVIIMGVGIGAPNANYYNGTIEHPPNLVWEGIIPLADLFKKYFDVPVVVTNDANAAAMGEMIFGGARGMKHFIEYTLGTGLGSGIVINGEILYGHTGFAGEIGHIIMKPGGRDCGCGRQGCLENYASATGLVRTMHELLGKRRDESKLRKIPCEDLDSKQIAEAANEGDKIALEAFDDTAKILALSIANAVAFSSPEAVFLFGGLANAGDLIFKPTRKYMEETLQIMFKGTVKLLPSEIPESKGAVMGASALAWNEILNK